MAGKNTAAFGIYRDEPSVKHAVETLQRQGFRSTDISVLLPQNLGNKDFGQEKATKAPEGAATGAGSGAVVGGVLGWLVGVASMRNFVTASTIARVDTMSSLKPPMLCGR